MKKVYFNDVPNIGDLSLEKVLFSFESIPIVFICTNETNEKFLCLCNDVIEEECWMISKISVSKLLDILYDKITVFNAFKTSDHDIIIATQNQNNLIYEVKTFDEIDALDLPDENEFLEMQQYLKDYIAALNKENELELNQLIAKVFSEVCHEIRAELRTWEIENIIVEKTNVNKSDYFKDTVQLENLYNKSTLYKSSLDNRTKDSTVSISDSFYFAA